MKDDAKAQRREQIETAAYALLAEKGFQNMSMLAIAKAAKASNETLYRWYGDKLGLFQSLIEANVNRVADTLQARLDAASDPRDALTELGPLLLSMLLGERAIALNRAAAADATGALGRVLAEAGRGQLFPRIVTLFAQLVNEGILRGAPGEIAALYIDLLVGDLQIRRATGALGPLTEAELAARARRAEERLYTLTGAA